MSTSSALPPTIAPPEDNTGPSGDGRAWQELANCKGVESELFFPGRGASTKEAKAVCQSCVVQSECLEYALANSEKFGIWGGCSERERRRIRKARREARRESATAPKRAASSE